MPNGAYLHLLINHVPVILAPIGALALILAWLTQRRAVWLYGLASVTLAGISAYPTMATGHSAVHVVRQAVPSIERSAVHEHEESGELAMWVLLASGIVSAFGWWKLGKSDVYSGTLPIWMKALTLLLALAGAGTVTYASYTSGYIIHHEIHSAAPTPGGAGSAAADDDDHS